MYPVYVCTQIHWIFYVHLSMPQLINLGPNVYFWLSHVCGESFHCLEKIVCWNQSKSVASNFIGLIFVHINFMTRVMYVCTRNVTSGKGTTFIKSSWFGVHFEMQSMLPCIQPCFLYHKARLCLSLSCVVPLVYC
jgi:hypothetical protein